MKKEAGTYCGAATDEKKMASAKRMKSRASQSMSISGAVGLAQKRAYYRGGQPLWVLIKVRRMIASLVLRAYLSDECWLVDDVCARPHSN